MRNFFKKIDETVREMWLGGGPDLEKLAQAYGMDFIRLEAPDKMDEAIDAFLKDEDAVLMECVINPMDTVK